MDDSERGGAGSWKNSAICPARNVSTGRASRPPPARSRPRVRLAAAPRFVGVSVGSAVFPIAFSITWAKCSGFAAISGAIGGLCGAIIA